MLVEYRLGSLDKGGQMATLCVACSRRSEYVEFQHRALELDASLGGQYPSGVDLGGLAFLGRHYAHSRSILLTLNPTSNPNKEFSARLFEHNLHWEGAPRDRYRNWTFARHLFRNMAGISHVGLTHSYPHDRPVHSSLAFA